MAATLDDERDVAAARSGDRVAFSRLLERHWSLLQRVCQRGCASPTDADDAVQEAALQAMISLDRLQRPDRFAAWLCGIGLNQCRRQRRQAARQAWTTRVLAGGRLEPPGNEIGQIADAAPDPAEALIATETQARIETAIAALPPGQQVAVATFYLDGLPQFEIAALLGISPGAVKTRLHKGRANLRQQLVDEPPQSSIAKGADMIEVSIVDVLGPKADASEHRHFGVMLRDNASGAVLPIWIGEAEANSLAFHLTGTATPRPMTYALMSSLLTAIGGQLIDVRIESLHGETYYATLTVDGARGKREIDARPSDALNLALLTSTPIHVAEILRPRFLLPEDGQVTRLVDETAGAREITASVLAQWERET